MMRCPATLRHTAHLALCAAATPAFSELWVFFPRARAPVRSHVPAVYCLLRVLCVGGSSGSRAHASAAHAHQATVRMLAVQRFPPFPLVAAGCIYSQTFAARCDFPRRFANVGFRGHLQLQTGADGCKLLHPFAVDCTAHSGGMRGLRAFRGAAL